MKKRLALLMMVLVFLLTACVASVEQPDGTTTESKQQTETSEQTEMTTTAETTQQTETTAETESPADYTVFCGNYSDTETVEGPCYTVSIISADNEAGEMEFSISFIGPNSSPVYSTDVICGTVTSDHTVEFEWEDSWENRGVGTLIVDPSDPATVQLMMTVTEEAEVNRATLSTKEQYKTLTRR